MKYKVGDKVRVKPFHDLREDSDGIHGLISEMRNMAGKTITIKEINPERYGERGHTDYIVEETSGYYYWTDEMFVGLAEEDTHKYKIGSKVRIASEDMLRHHKSIGPSINDQMVSLADKVTEITGCITYDGKQCYRIKEDRGNNIWTNGMFTTLEKEKKKEPFYKLWLDTTYMSFEGTWGTTRTSHNPGDRVRLKNADALKKILRKSPWADINILQNAGQVVTIADPHAIKKTWYKIQEDGNTYSEEMFA